MRITIVSRRFPPAGSGIADHTDRLAGELAARGHAVSVVCSGEADERASFDVRPVRRWRARAITRAVTATAPEIVLWQYNPFEIGRRGLASSAARVARALARRSPLVVLFHELYFPWGRAGLKGLAWAIAQRLQARAVLRAAASSIVTTASRERALHRRGRVVRRVPVGSNVDVLGVSARASYGIPDDAFVLAHLGGVGPGKDLATVLEALRRVRARGVDARVLLAGRTGPVERPADMNGELIMTGPLADLSPALAAADAYLHPDPSGPSVGRRTSLVAALAHRLPVVAFRGSDHDPELVEGRNLVLAEPDPDALAEAIRGLAEIPERRRAMADAARAAYEDAFTWDRIAAAVEEALAEAAR